MQKIKLRTKRNTNRSIMYLTVTALLVAISIILGRFNFFIPLFGYPSVRFSLTGIPIFIVGAMFGGVYGGMAGVLSDIMNFFLASSGPYHPGFTLNSALTGIIPGIVFGMLQKKTLFGNLKKDHLENDYLKNDLTPAKNYRIYGIKHILLATILTYMLVHLCLTPIWINQMYQIPMMASFTVRIVKSIVDIPLQVTIIYITLRALKRSAAEVMSM